MWVRPRMIRLRYKVIMNAEDCEVLARDDDGQKGND
jgi:hypothetical protein